MREIKFRAWHKTTKTMLQVGDNAGTTHPLDCCVYSMQRQPVELMQYTGLKDKNAREIYEGDLIKDSDSKEIGQVIWDDTTLCWTTKFEDNDLWGFVPRKGRDNHCEVIGNVYQNPELLEVKNATT